MGANNHLEELYKFLTESEETLRKELAFQGIQWSFIPPRAPNFGGLWEAGVKSVKYHLTRTIRNANLDYEQLTTVLCQIESVLNSRPLCRLTGPVNTWSFHHREEAHRNSGRRRPFDNSR